MGFALVRWGVVAVSVRGVWDGCRAIRCGAGVEKCGRGSPCLCPCLCQICLYSSHDAMKADNTDQHARARTPNASAGQEFHARAHKWSGATSPTSPRAYSSGLRPCISAAYLNLSVGSGTARNPQQPACRSGWWGNEPAPRTFDSTC